MRIFAPESGRGLRPATFDGRDWHCLGMSAKRGVVIRASGEACQETRGGPAAAPASSGNTENAALIPARRHNISSDARP